MTADLRRLVVVASPWWRRMALGVGLQWATIAASVGLMATSAWLISTAGLHPSIAAVQVAVVGVRFFGISRGVLRYLERLVSHDVTLRLLATLRVHAFERLVPLAPARLVHARRGDLVGRLVGDIETLDQFYLRVAGPALAALAVAASMVLLLVPFGVGLAVAAGAGLAGGGIVAPWVAWRLGRHHAADVVRYRARLEAQVVDTVQGLADLTAFGRVGDHLDRLRATGADAASAEVKGTRSAAAGGALSALAADLSVVALLALAIPLVGRGELQGVHLAVVALATLAAFEAVVLLPAALQQLGASREAARRVFAILDAAPAVAPPPKFDRDEFQFLQPSGVPTPSGDEALAAASRRGAAGHGPVAGRRLSIRHLTFAYADGERPVLEDVSLDVAPGRLVAVVGPSGAGKSTLAHLLLRFWDVADGTVFLDEIDVRRLDPDAVRAQFAFAGQRADLLTGTLAENLRLARPGAPDEVLVAALTRVGLGAWLAALPAGLATWVGEQGQALSGGERQRVALARAFLRPAPLLLLDEPTAHVDAVMEQALLREIRRHATARCGLIITHRLSGLDIADEILVLVAGRVVERGDFAGLVRAHGWFRRLLDRQRAARVIDRMGGTGATGSG